MDKIQKTAAWIWLYKERIIFVVMVMLLGQRVWLVMNPQPIIDVPPTPLEPAKSEIMAGGPAPPPPPTPPIIYVPNPDPELIRKNPFWVHAGSSSVTQTGPQEVALSLQIVTGGSTPRAQIRSGNSRRGSYYKAGDTVEGFTVRDIDVEAETVTLVNEATGEQRTLQRS